jgi:hypothetical protein
MLGPGRCRPGVTCVLRPIAAPALDAELYGFAHLERATSTHVRMGSEKSHRVIGAARLQAACSPKSTPRPCPR